MRQYPLDLTLPVNSRFDTFVDRGNEETIAIVRGVADHPRGAVLFLWGVPGVGKSHLVQACCHQLSADQRPFLYMGMDDWCGQSAEVFDELEGDVTLIIDDLDRIVGDPRFEEALFHLFNRMLIQDGGMVVTAERPPAQLGVRLPDLASRLASGVVAQVHELDDDGLRMAMQARGQRMGMALSDSVVDFLLRRISRDMPTVIRAMEAIDAHSLATKSRPTVPLVKRALELD